MLRRRPQERVACRRVGWKMDERLDRANAERNLVQDVPLRIEPAVAVTDGCGVLCGQSRVPSDLLIEVGDEARLVVCRGACTEHGAGEPLALLAVMPSCD